MHSETLGPTCPGARNCANKRLGEGGGVEGIKAQRLKSQAETDGSVF